MPEYSKIFNILNNRIKLFLLLFFFQLIILLFSFDFFTFRSFFWPDHKYVEYVHNLSLNKKIFEVLSNSQNLNGITLTIINPYLNFLSFLNYNLKSIFDYYIYLFFLRFFEICVILVHLKFFIKKIKIEDLVGVLFIYIILLANTSGFDHQSYINFPILIFCFFHGVSLFLKKNKYFFLILFVGNFWAYTINPIYFFVTCFFPLIFYYTYFFFKKEYSRFLLIFLANLPFAVSFILLSLGTARVAMPDIFPGSQSHYNFTIHQSKTFLILSLIFCVFSIKLIYEKKNYFFSYFFIIITFLTLLFGKLYILNPDKWKIPQPEYLDYSFQNIFIVILWMILKLSKHDKIKKILILFILIIFLFRSFFFINFYQITKKHINDSKVFVGSNRNLVKSFFWYKDTDDNFIFRNDLKDKITLINIPNINSKLYESSFKDETSKQSGFDILKYAYNLDFFGSLGYVTFWRNGVKINEGHSQLLDISSTLANLEKLKSVKYYNSKYNNYDVLYFSGEKILEMQTIPKISYNSPLIEFYNIDLILSDVVLDLKIFKEYKFNNYSVFLYKTPEVKREYNRIKNIFFIDSFKNYQGNINTFNDSLYIDRKQEFDNNINSFCKITEIKSKSSNKIFDIIANNVNGCVAVLPIPFSYTNDFYFYENSKDKNSLTKCETFRVQYYFHGCKIKYSSRVILKKKNLFVYPIASFKDYLEYQNIKKNDL
jgi:hypothetical protein